MGIAQGATPYLMISVEGQDLSGSEAVKVSIKTAQVLLNFDLPRVVVTTDGTDSLLTVHLTQDDTLALVPRDALIQVRWRKNGESHITDIVHTDVHAALFKGVI